MSLRTPVILILLLFFMCSCAQVFQSGHLSRDRTYLESHDTQITSTESEDNPLLAEDNNPADGDPSTIDDFSEEERIESEIAANSEVGPNGDKTAAGNFSSPKKAQPVLDDALDLCQLSQDF